MIDKHFSKIMRTTQHFHLPVNAFQNTFRKYTKKSQVVKLVGCILCRVYCAQCYMMHVWMTFRQTKVNVVSTLVNYMDECSDVCSLIVFNGQEGLHIRRFIVLLLHFEMFFYMFYYISNKYVFYPCVLNLPFPGLYQIRDGRILRNKIHLAVYGIVQTQKLYICLCNT